MRQKQKKSLNPRKPRQRKCRTCREWFLPRNGMQVVCGIKCAIEYSKVVQEKKQRKEDAKRLKELMSKSDHEQVVQKAFNAYIRERDKGMPCICCGRPLTGGSGYVGGYYDCGHYRSIGSAPHLRFDERNAHAQRKQCNRHGAGRAVDYRLGLIKRIGIEQVEALEADNAPKHYTIDDLKALAKKYRRKLRELKRNS